jgi:two-component system chemotaxis response regulator CheB
MNGRHKIRVLIADGSVVDRERMAALLRADPEMEVVGEIVRSGSILDEVRKRLPDVILLGINLPPAGGFETTREIMIEAPTPVIIVSDQTDAREVDASILALRAGALAVAPRPPQVRESEGPAVLRFIATVKSMAGVKVVRHWREPARRGPRMTSWKQGAGASAQPQIVAVAASTGGPAAIRAAAQLSAADLGGAAHRQRVCRRLGDVAQRPGVG